MKNIVAALDFSQTTPRVLEQSKALAEAMACHLWLIHVEAPEPDFVGYDAGPQSVRDQVSAEMREDHQLLQQHADELREQGLETTALLLQGATAQAIVEKAAELEADLLVVGSHGRSGLSKLLMGSVSEAVLRQAPCSVVVVPMSS